jgi:hypothetical protein
MEFREFKAKFHKHVKDILDGQSALFVVDVDKDLLWNTYLDSFPPGTNEVYRERREMDCSCCRHFIQQFGNVATIRDNKLVTVWDFNPNDSTYTPVVNALSQMVNASVVENVFVTKQSAHGTDKSKEMLENGNVHTWDHFSVELPKRFVDISGKSINETMASYRDVRNVFQRSLDEISIDSVETVLDMIAEKTLYRGEEWQGALQKFLELKKKYAKLPQNERDNFCWSKSVEVGGSIGKIRNHSIGVLLQDIADGMEIDAAVRRYESIVAPTNYKRPKAILTKKMIEDAEKNVVELGLLESLGRRHATLNDITINSVLWANRNAKNHMGGAGGVFEVLKQETSFDPKKFKDVQGIGIDEFIENVLPTAKSVEILLENRHESSLMSLIAPQVPDSQTLFKWNNAFSWAYNGNIADSMKQRVKAAGGNVEGVLRFSLQWNDAHDNQNDYDAHCVEPNGNHIWFQNKGHKHYSTGMLDVDIIQPDRDQVAVENITWTDIGRMQEGEYEFFVHTYSHRGGRSGFDVEIEYDGQVYEYGYHKDLAQGDKVTVAKLKFSKKDGITFIKSLPSTTSAKTIWNLQTNQFHPVSVFMFSPNYWDGQTGVGNRHFFFMLAGCKNETQPNGFFNEYLREEFMEHKRVFEALGGKMKVEASDNQLSGLGFSSTKRNSLIAKVDGRMTKIIF